MQNMENRFRYPPEHKAGRARRQIETSEYRSQESTRVIMCLSIKTTYSSKETKRSSEISDAAGRFESLQASTFFKGVLLHSINICQIKSLVKGHS
jgi:hypothetical protein